MAQQHLGETNKMVLETFIFYLTDFLIYGWLLKGKASKKKPLNL